jgi:hypothetical protein
VDDPDVPFVARARLAPLRFLDLFDDLLDRVELGLVIVDSRPDLLLLGVRQRPFEDLVLPGKPQRAVNLDEEEDERRVPKLSLVQGGSQRGGTEGRFIRRRRP